MGDEIKQAIELVKKAGGDPHELAFLIGEAIGAFTPRLSEPRLDLIKDTLSYLEEHPPIYTRHGNQPHSGERDCGACGYPLTGCVKDGLPPHDKYEGDGMRPGPCKYMRLLARLRHLIQVEEEMGVLDQLAEEAP